jgi:hypothetical protein
MGNTTLKQFYTPFYSNMKCNWLFHFFEIATYLQKYEPARQDWQELWRPWKRISLFDMPGHTNVKFHSPSEHVAVDKVDEVIVPFNESYFQAAHS